jgi:hypothetical protein
VLLIDAANVVGSRPTGWWRDRPGAARDLVVRVERAVAQGTLQQPVVVVLEGQARSGVEEGERECVKIVHAPGSGDDKIVEVASRSSEPVTLVTADRGLRSRTTSQNVQIVGPNWLLDRLPSIEDC